MTSYQMQISEKSHKNMEVLSFYIRCWNLILKKSSKRKLNWFLTTFKATHSEKYEQCDSMCLMFGMERFDFENNKENDIR